MIFGDIYACDTLVWAPPQASDTRYDTLNYLSVCIIQIIQMSVDLPDLILREILLSRKVCRLVSTARL